MSGIVNIAVIGNNFGAKVHVPAFQSIDNVKIAGIFSRNWEDAINDPNINAITIATPPAIAYDIIKSAMQNNKHVFCEKPGVANWAQCLQLKKLLHTSVIHAIDFEMDEILIVKHVKQLLQLKYFGEIKSFDCFWYSSTSNSRNSWKLDVYQGGGALNNFGSHVFHMLEYIFNDTMNSISGDLLPEIQYNMVVDAEIKFATFGGHVVIDANTDYASYFHLAINCEDGNFILTNNTNNMSNFTLITKVHSQSTIVKQGNNIDQDGRISLVNHVAKKFIDGILVNQQVYPNLHDGIRVQFINDMLLKQIG